MKKLKIAVFASGRGSNARAIIDFTLVAESSYEIALIISNKKSASVLDLAIEREIPSAVIRRKDLYDTDKAIEILQSRGIDFIVLAGFLWLIPPSLVEAYPQRILNIHPALLPKYGGKGMYGMHVHRAVAEAGDNVSGMTIHYVNKSYDEGNIIFQSRCQIEKDDGAAEIGARVLRLEHHFYPKVINGVCSTIQQQPS